MAWTTIEKIAVVLHQDLDDDPFIEGLIEHAQGLAENEIGEQTQPNNKLISVFTNIVARMWQASKEAQINPAALDSSVTGPYRFEKKTPGVAGLGLTNREKAELCQAVGKRTSALWVQPLTRGPGMELGPNTSGLDAQRSLTPEQMIEVAGGVDSAPWFALEDLR